MPHMVGPTLLSSERPSISSITTPIFNAETPREWQGGATPTGTAIGPTAIPSDHLPQQLLSQDKLYLLAYKSDLGTKNKKTNKR